MKSISCTMRHTTRISDDELFSTALTLEPEIMTIKEALTKGYNSEYAFCSLPMDHNIHQEVIDVANKKLTMNPAAHVVIGVGGSNLGAKAVYEALRKNIFEHESCLVYWVDTFDPDIIQPVYSSIERLLQEKKTVIISLVSKSGTTLEVQVNGALFIDLLKRYRPLDYAECIVVITDYNSLLWQKAYNKGYTCLAIPPLVGGRFSIFSSAGLFPLAMMGIDIRELSAGAASMLTRCLDTDIEHNPAALSSSLLDLHYFRGYYIHDIFIFASGYMSLGSWYRQLLAESLGKISHRTGSSVRVGMVPTLSLGTTDLHSVAQLYLAGPRNRFTSFITIEKNFTNVPIPQEESLFQTVNHVGSLQQCMSAAAQGTMIAYKKQELPYMQCEFPDKTANVLGQFLQMKMVEVLYFGYLLDVNPFDQPHVELYKQEMRKLLNHE